jgi:hypothetical protein
MLQIRSAKMGSNPRKFIFRFFLSVETILLHQNKCQGTLLDRQQQEQTIIVKVWLIICLGHRVPTPQGQGLSLEILAP